MTEREAWLELESICRAASESDEASYMAGGFSRQLQLIEQSGRITTDQRYSMLDKLWRFSGAHGGIRCVAWKWPLTRDGARQRADFCRAMAEQCGQPGAGAEPVT